MTLALRRRGPDGSGVWVDAEAGVALGHRRLAILDLSQEGAQPKASRSGRYLIVFNGEIYNFRRLRSELEQRGHLFTGRSDTEVLLAAIEQWGVPDALPRLTGMFAFGVWDRRERRLFLARDRAGEKPLYYGWNGPRFFFASELKGLRANPRFSPDLDWGALTSYLRFGYVPDPRCVYRGLQKLGPGHYAEVDPSAQGSVTPKAYWRATARVEHGLAQPFGGTEDEAVDELDAILREVVDDQMIADVPLGIFLSGGIDSSLVAALAQAQSRARVNTFSIGFELGGYDEAVHAKEVAKHLGTNHRELYVSADDALGVIPRLATIYDEPFADASQVPTYLLSKMAREHVAVCLSGEGGDEVFGGYNRYLWVPRVWNVLRRSPEPLKRAAAGVIHGLSPERWSSLYARIPSALMPELLRVELPGHRLYKLASVLSAGDRTELYQMLISCWSNPEQVFRAAELNVVWPERPPTDLPGRDFVEQMMLSDFMTYLAGDVLVKVDRAAMANGLETRVPYLDHRVFDFAWTLPLHFRIRGRTSKWIARQLLNRYVPPHLINRPKMGFSLPLAEWLRGPLRGWAEALVEESSTKYADIFDASTLRRLWSTHLQQRQNAEAELWCVLVLQGWLGQQQTRPEQPRFTVAGGEVREH